MQIEEYRTRLENFDEALKLELYQYYSGLKEHLDIVNLYSDNSDFFAPDSIREVESELDRTSEYCTSRRKSLEKIKASLIDQYLDFRAAQLNQQIVVFETGRTLQYEGNEILISHVPACLKKEPDAVKRRNLSERRAKILRESETIRRERIALLRSTSIALGFKNYFEVWESLSGVDYQSLLRTMDDLLDALEYNYLDNLNISLQADLGLSPHEAGSWDVARWEFINNREDIFRERESVPALEETISQLGIQCERPGAISLDTDPRPRKQPKPFCVPIRIPHQIKIVMLPQGGCQHLAALLHESGHAHHFAWTSPSLPCEHRICGDRGLSESYAFLLENLLFEREWLEHMFSFTPSLEFLRFRWLFRLYLLRRHAGRLCYELKVHQQESNNDLPQTYSDTMRQYTGLLHESESYLYDLSDGFYSADYLRGWVYEAMLREYLRIKYGKSWFFSRSAGNFLKEIWETGQQYRADELFRDIGMGDFEPAVLARELLQGLQQ